MLLPYIEKRDKKVDITNYSKKKTQAQLIRTPLEILRCPKGEKWSQWQ
jgi:hypothetical protein